MATINELIEDFVTRRHWAVVGVSADREKYGHRVFASLIGSGYEVDGVNPKNGEVLGRHIYTSLADLPKPPDVVDIVVPPAATEQVVRECCPAGPDAGVDAARR